MKKEYSQNSHQGNGSSENADDNRNQQKSQWTDVPNNEQNDFARRAGLGRDRMTDIEDAEGSSGRDDYLDSDKDDLSNKNLNASNDQ